MPIDPQIIPLLRSTGVGYGLEQQLAGDLPRLTGAAPAAAAGADNGTTPPAPVVAAGSTDGRGSLTFGSGSAPAAGDQVVVTFASPYASKPVVTVVASNAAITKTVLGQLTPAEVSTTGFKVRSSAAPGVSQANTTYELQYQVTP
jgi:hypothetical protein